MRVRQERQESMPSARSPHRAKTVFASRAADALVIALSLWAGVALRGIAWTDRYTIACVLAMLLFHVFAESRRLYRPWHGASARQYLWPVLVAGMWTALGLFVLAWITKSTGHYSRVAIGLWAVLGLLGLVSWRVFRHAFLDHARAHGRRRIAIAGAGERAREFARIVRSTPSLGLTPAGFFADHGADDDPKTTAGTELPAPLLGDLDALVERVRANEFDLVYIALPMRAEERIGRLVTALSDTTTPIYIVPDLFIHDLAHSRWIDLGPVSVISVFETRFSGIEGWSKRLEDLVLSTLILIAAAVPMLLIATAVKLTSPGPVLFRQRRNGFDGSEISVWKFRTMTTKEDGARVTQAVRGDRRVTPIGAFLRRTSLDELPQFFNVLGGSMSVVGPRPHALAHTERYRGLIPGYMLRHRVKPGITGWAQIHGLRGTTDTIEKMERRVQHDLWYIQRWSLWLDLWIVARTALLVFGDENAW